MSARILLVEDEVNMARTLAKNLERAGYAVAHAGDGEAALAVLANESFDVILTDLKMPVLDGMGLLRAIHDRSIATSVIVLTGYGTIESAVEAMKRRRRLSFIKTRARRSPPSHDRAHAEAAGARARERTPADGDRSLRGHRRARRRERGDAVRLPARRRRQPDEEHRAHLRRERDG
jgi:DNA-binding NtrC family response regulator